MYSTSIYLARYNVRLVGVLKNRPTEGKSPFPSLNHCQSQLQTPIIYAVAATWVSACVCTYQTTLCTLLRTTQCFVRIGLVFVCVRACASVCVCVTFVTGKTRNTILSEDARYTSIQRQQISSPISINFAYYKCVQNGSCACPCRCNCCAAAFLLTHEFK